MHNILKTAAIAAIGVVLLGVTSCGGNHRKVPSTGALPAESKLISLQDALAQLDALQKPDGVNDVVWNELKSALKSALSTNYDLRATKLVSSPPTGAANKVNDLTATRETNGNFTLSWHYRNLGDYDQNGIVGVSDITPLAQHFGETYDTQTGSDSIQAVIDGSGNAKIGVEDVTQIAQNFGVAVAKYSVRGGDAYAGPFAETAIVGVSPQVSDARKVLTMNIGASPQGYWQVVPQDAEDAQGEASNIAGISLQILSVTPTEVKEGTIVTFSADVLGAGPFTYEWDFGGQAVPSTSTEASPKVVLTRDTGGFPARLTVTNHLSNAAYPFTLTKLAREWKYEVVLDGVLPITKAGRLCFQNQRLWFSAYTGDLPPKSYQIAGLPGSWEYVERWGLVAFDENGNEAVLQVTGAPLNATLVYAETIDGAWTETTLASSMSFLNTAIAIGPDDEVFITYTPNPGDNLIHTVHGRMGSLIEGTLDYAFPASNNRWGLGALVANSETPPIAVYCNESQSPPNNAELKFAQWNAGLELWDIGLIERDGDTYVYQTGYFPTAAFSLEGKASAAYSNVITISDGAYEDHLIYTKLDSGSWVKELIDVKPPLGTQVNINVYKSKSLAYDPLGNPLVAYTLYKGYVDSQLNDVMLAWRSQGSWQLMPIDSDGQNDQSSVSIAFDDRGAPYVLYADTANKEVVLARYE